MALLLQRSLYPRRDSRRTFSHRFFSSPPDFLSLLPKKFIFATARCFISQQQQPSAYYAILSSFSVYFKCHSLETAPEKSPLLGLERERDGKSGRLLWVHTTSGAARAEMNCRCFIRGLYCPNQRDLWLLLLFFLLRFQMVIGRCHLPEKNKIKEEEKKPPFSNLVEICRSFVQNSISLFLSSPLRVSTTMTKKNEIERERRRRENFSSRIPPASIQLFSSSKKSFMCGWYQQCYLKLILPPLEMQS